MSLARADGSAASGEARGYAVGPAAGCAAWSRSADTTVESVVAARLDAYAPGSGSIVVGVSGGVDSIVLLNAITATGRSVIAAHVNYHLRGDASDEDERFVRAECERIGAACRVLQAEDAPGASIQAWAREVRYDWFERVAAQSHADAVAVAHHADDQAETVLINIIRGTGIDGLAGMRPVRPVSRGSEVMLIRPMLDLGRTRIEAYARAHDLAWREDASNESGRYLRSRVRSWLDGASDIADPVRLAAIAGRAAVTAAVLRRSVVELGFPAPVEGAGHPGTNRTSVDLPDELFDAVPPAVAGWVVSRMLSEIEGAGPRNRRVVSDVVDLLTSQPGRRVEVGDAIIWRLRDGLRFETAPRTDPGSAPEQTFRIGDIVRLPRGRLESEWCDPPDSADIDLPRHEAVLNADLLSADLSVRPWRSGDRLQPLGMEGQRKVKEILTDRKVPPPEKSGVHVVCSGSDIVWIVGADIDHRFRITPATQRAARFKFLVS